MLTTTRLDAGGRQRECGGLPLADPRTLVGALRALRHTTTTSSLTTTRARDGLCSLEARTRAGHCSLARYRAFGAWSV